MRVLHVIPAVAPRYGGPSAAVVGMVRALRSSGVDATLVATDADGEGRLRVQIGREAEWEGLPCWFFPRQWSEAWKLSWPLARWLRAHVREWDLVHVHAVFSHACFAAGDACRRAGVPYVVRPLGTLDPWSLSQKPWRKRLAWRLGGRSLLRGAGAVHYTSEAERRRTEESLGIGKGVVIPLGVDACGLRMEATAAAPRAPLGRHACVVALGRLDPKKGVDLLCDAFLDVAGHPSAAGWHLAFVGDGDATFVSGLRRRVASRAGGERVHWLGWLSGPDKAATLSAAKLLVLPSARENFGLAVVEGLALGVPALLSPGVDIADELAGAGAARVVPRERGALSAALLDAFRHPDELARTGAQGRALVDQRYSWGAVTERLVAMYRRLAA